MSVNGKAVIATEPAFSPLSTPDRPVQFRQVQKILFDDGSEQFGCVKCDFRADKWQSVQAHARSHKPAKVDVPRPVLAMTLADIIDVVARSDSYVDVVLSLQEDRDRWRGRAKEAEKRLNVLRNALGQS